MKTREQVLEIIKSEELKSEAIDGRDFSRLADFFPVEDWIYLGFKPKANADINPIVWSKENLLIQLKRDLEFAFEKALDQRGISASCMYVVVKMWLWILEDELSECEEYAQYGLPLLKKVAVKYGFDNPIGDDYGDESKYEG